MMDWSKVLFVGWGGLEGVSHYRSVLPARTLGAEWVIFDMQNRPIFGEHTHTKHDIIVVQNCWARWQLYVQDRMRQSGAKVVANVDDWIKTIGKMGDAHGESKYFGQKEVHNNHREYIARADAVLASTPYLLDRLGKINGETYLARNGLDLDRYLKWRDPLRDSGVIIGWAGGTGHKYALASIVPAIATVLRETENVSFWLIGEYYMDLFPADVRDKVIHRPWSDMSLYPEQLSCLDINLAPALKNDFYKAKSQLRLYEGWALGTPTIASPLYDEIEHGVDGFICDTHEEWLSTLRQLISDEELRERVREASKLRAPGISIESRISDWSTALEEIHAL